MAILDGRLEMILFPSWRRCGREGRGRVSHSEFLSRAVWKPESPIFPCVALSTSNKPMPLIGPFTWLAFQLEGQQVLKKMGICVALRQWMERATRMHLNPKSKVSTQSALLSTEPGLSGKWLFLKRFSFLWSRIKSVDWLVGTGQSKTV